MSYGHLHPLQHLGDEAEPDIAPEQFPASVHTPQEIKAYADMLSELLLREERNSLDACKRIRNRPAQRHRCKKRVTTRFNRQRKRLTGAVLHAMRRALGGGFVTWAQGTASAVAEAASAFQPMPAEGFSMPAQTPRGYQPPPPSAAEARYLALTGSELPGWVAPVAIGGGALALLLIVYTLLRRRRRAAEVT